jgi:uncharacterized membrane protein YdjX (TVP38/TMEM64 family)
MKQTLKKQHYIKLAIALGLIAVLIGLVLHLELNIDKLRGMLLPLVSFRDRAPFSCALSFLLLYVVVAALCLPVEIPLALAAGALFGFWSGLFIASFAANIGAVLAFLMSRFFFRDSVESLFRRNLDVVNAGIAKDGVFYVVALRLLPVFPFFLTNVTLGVTGMRVGTFYILSQLSTLPAIAIYANAGTHLADVRSFADVLTPPLLTALALLGALPWIAKAGFKALRAVKLRGDT